MDSVREQKKLEASLPWRARPGKNAEQNLIPYYYLPIVDEWNGLCNCSLLGPPYSAEKLVRPSFQHLDHPTGHNHFRIYELIRNFLRDALIKNGYFQVIGTSPAGITGAGEYWKMFHMPHL